MPVSSRQLAPDTRPLFTESFGGSRGVNSNQSCAATFKSNAVRSPAGVIGAGPYKKRIARRGGGEQESNLSSSRTPTRGLLKGVGIETKLLYREYQYIFTSSILRNR